MNKLFAPTGLSRSIKGLSTENMNQIGSMNLETLRKLILFLGANARYLLKKTELDKGRQRTFRDKENYRTELVQVAAVAIAALTDLDMEEGGLSQEEAEAAIWSDILDERERQDSKFGRQMPVGLDPLIWGAVLIEEIAEVLAEVNPE